MAVKCSLIVNRVGKSSNAWRTIELPVLPPIGSFMKVDDGAYKMFYKVVGIQFVPDDPTTDVYLLLDEMPNSRDGAPIDYIRMI